MPGTDLSSLYVCGAYTVFLLLCAAGAFSRSYDANLAQRLALALLALWAAWRIELVLRSGWGYPHETLVATALLLYATGSLYKTIKYLRAARGRRRRGA